MTPALFEQCETNEVKKAAISGAFPDARAPAGPAGRWASASRSSRATSSSLTHRPRAAGNGRIVEKHTALGRWAVISPLDPVSTHARAQWP
jgi:hypothetical protein